jgi:hypothetical protein
VGLEDASDGGLGLLLDADLGGALRAVHGEDHRVLAVEAGEGAHFLEGVRHGAEVRQAYLRARGQRDGRGREALGVALVAQEPDGLLAAAEVGAARALVRVGGADLRGDRRGRDAVGVEARGVELDQDLALGAAVAVDPGPRPDGPGARS